MLPFTIEDNSKNSERTISSHLNLYHDAEQTTFEEVGGICPNKDDPNINSLTLRSFLIGLIFLLGMSFYHMWYYVTNLYAVITPVIALLIAHLIGKIWALISGTSWTMKEHTIVLVMSNIAWSFAVVYDVSGISFLEYQEQRPNIQFIHIFFFVVSIQFLGFGIAGILRRFLVWPSAEVWPSNFPSIALLRALHRTPVVTNINGGHVNGRLSFWQKFLSNQLLFYFVIMIAQFIFYWFPGYIAPVLGSFSWICMIKRDNNILGQLTDFRGLSLGSLSFSWYTLTYFLNSPIVVPLWALVNMAVGFVLVAWVLTPIIYFQNVWETRSNTIATTTQSPSNWSAMGLVTTFAAFASLSSVFVHMFLHHSQSLWDRLRNSSSDKKGNDIHCRLIGLYPDVPDWWFAIVSVLSVTVIMIVSHVSEMLEWYNVLFSLSIPIIFILPFGMVSSITGQFIQNQGVYYLMVIIVGVLWSGEQAKMMTFIAVGYNTYCQTLYLVSNMKLGHYMKIAPRSLFLVQTLSCLVCSSFSAGIQYYFFAVRRYYEQPGAFDFTSLFDLSNVGSSIVNGTNFFDSSISQNRQFLWSLLIGAILPVPFWLASKRYRWCRLIHIPLMLATVSWMPLVDTGGLFTWILVGLVTAIVFRKECWKRHMYLTSSALDAGMYLSLAIIGGPLANYNIIFPNWWGIGGPSGTGCPFSQQNPALAQSFNPGTFGT